MVEPPLAPLPRSPAGAWAVGTPLLMFPPVRAGYGRRAPEPPPRRGAARPIAASRRRPPNSDQTMDAAGPGGSLAPRALGRITPCGWITRVTFVPAAELDPHERWEAATPVGEARGEAARLLAELHDEPDRIREQAEAQQDADDQVHGPRGGSQHLPGHGSSPPGGPRPPTPNPGLPHTPTRSVTATGPGVGTPSARARAVRTALERGIPARRLIRGGAVPEGGSSGTRPRG